MLPSEAAKNLHGETLENLNKEYLSPNFFNNHKKVMLQPNLKASIFPWRNCFPGRLLISHTRKESIPGRGKMNNRKGATDIFMNRSS